MLRRVGSLLLLTGATVGVGVGTAILVGFRPASLSWLVAIGLAKLGLLASGGLMVAGGFCVRLDRRVTERRALAAGQLARLKDSSSTDALARDRETSES